MQSTKHVKLTRADDFVCIIDGDKRENVIGTVVKIISKVIKHIMLTLTILEKYNK